MNLFMGMGRMSGRPAGALSDLCLGAKLEFETVMSNVEVFGKLT